jgi:hypothetical protein
VFGRIRAVWPYSVTMLTNRETGVLARVLGHDDFVVRETRSGRHVAHCGCGYESVSYLRMADAGREMLTHLRRVTYGIDPSVLPKAEFKKYRTLLEYLDTLADQRQSVPRSA